MNKKNPENESPKLDVSKNKKKTKNSKNDTNIGNPKNGIDNSNQSVNERSKKKPENEAPKVDGSKNQKKSKSNNVEENETDTKIRAKTATISKQPDSKKTRVTKQKTPTIAKVCVLFISFNRKF